MLEKNFRLLVVLILFLYFPCLSYAHLTGQPPFFKVNGIYTHQYSIPESNIANMNVSQDRAPDLYLTNTPIEFDLDLKALGLPAYILKKTIFHWDMGDGTQLFGTKNTHAYKENGTYILTVYADSSENPQPLLIQSTLIHIVPQLTFIPPKAVLLINGQEVVDPSAQTFRFNYSQPLSFDVSRSGADILDVLWDFGDGQSAAGEIVKHQYDQILGGTVFPIVKVRFKNGYTDHQYVQIDKDISTPSSSGKTADLVVKTQRQQMVIIVMVVVALILSILVSALLFLRRKKRVTTENTL